MYHGGGCMCTIFLRCSVYYVRMYVYCVLCLPYVVCVLYVQHTLYVLCVLYVLYVLYVLCVLYVPCVLCTYARILHIQSPYRASINYTQEHTHTHYTLLPCVSELRPPNPDFICGFHTVSCTCPPAPLSLPTSRW